MSTTDEPRAPGWYPDPLRPERSERLWDGDQWTDLTRPPRDGADAAAGESETEDEAQGEVPESSEGGDEPAAGGAPARTTTLVLTAAVVLLVAVVGLQAAYLVGPLRDDAVVSAERPVLLDEAAQRSAVETAAEAAVAFTTRSYQTYDEQVDEAAAMMTEPYAEEFRATTDEVKPEFVAGEVEVTATVEAQAVMTASSAQVEALIFLTQYVAKKDADTAFTPYRIKVTLVDDPERGWLVSAVDTR